MLTRRSLFAAPAALVAVAGAATIPATPAMSREDALALIKGRIDEALAPYAGQTSRSLWGEGLDVVAEWAYYYRDKQHRFETEDDYFRHAFKCFFWNRPVNDLVKENRLVNEQGRLAHMAQLKLLQTFPIEPVMLDQAFIDALLMLKPES